MDTAADFEKSDSEDNENDDNSAEILKNIGDLEEALNKAYSLSEEIHSDWSSSINQTLLRKTIKELSTFLVAPLPIISYSPLVPEDKTLKDLASSVDFLMKEIKSIKRIPDIIQKTIPSQVEKSSEVKKTQTKKGPAPSPSSYAAAAASQKKTPAKPELKKEAPVNLITAPNRQIVIILKEKKGKISVDYKSLNQLNGKLRSAGTKAEIIAVSQSSAGNLLLNTREGDNAENLLTHRDLIVSHIFLSKTPDVTVRVNNKLFEFKIDHALRIDPYTNDHIPAEKIWEAAQEVDSMLKTSKLIIPPRWLGDKREGVAKGSILAAVGTEEEREKILATRQSCAFRGIIKFSKYVEKKKICYCASCGMMNHLTWTCRQKRCLSCTSTDHSTETHPEEIALKCITCKGNHHATDRSCPTRIARLSGRRPASNAKRAPNTKTNPPIPNSSGTAGTNNFTIHTNKKGKGKAPPTTPIPAPDFDSLSQKIMVIDDE